MSEKFILMSRGTSRTEEGAEVPCLFIHLSSNLSEIWESQKSQILDISNPVWNEHFEDIKQFRWQPRIDAFNNRTVVKATITNLAEKEYETLVIKKFRHRGPKTRKAKAPETLMSQKFLEAKQKQANE